MLGADSFDPTRPQACRAHQITDLHNLSNLISEIAEKKLYNNTLKVSFKSA
jgi:hypothetical protein